MQVSLTGLVISLLFALPLSLACALFCKRLAPQLPLPLHSGQASALLATLIALTTGFVCLLLGHTVALVYAALRALVGVDPEFTSIDVSPRSAGMGLLVALCGVGAFFGLRSGHEAAEREQTDTTTETLLDPYASAMAEGPATRTPGANG